MKMVAFAPVFLAMALGAAVLAETNRTDHTNRPGTPTKSSLAIDGLSIVGLNVIDYCAYAGLGEDNGGMDPGETASYMPILKNDLAYPITNVNAVLVSNFPEAIVLQDVATYPDIQPGETAGPNQPFLIQWNEHIEEHSPLITVRIVSNEGTWDTAGWLGGCQHFTLPLRREFEVWPLSGWSFHGDMGLGGWKSNSVWGNVNNTGGEGLCAEGQAAPSAAGSGHELWSPVLDFGSGVDWWVMHYRCNFQGAAGGGIAYVDLSTDAGISWITISMETVDDPAGGHDVNLWVPLQDITHNALVRFRLFGGTQGANWQIDNLYFLWAIGPAGPTPGTCVPCTSPPPPPPCDTPADAQLISPQDGITGLGTEVMLSWDPADHADAYEVFVGPRMGEFTLMGTTTDTSFLLLGLAEGTRYEWMISAVNECDFNHSRVWAFTTAGGEDDGGHVRPVSPP